MSELQPDITCTRVTIQEVHHFTPAAHDVRPKSKSKAARIYGAFGECMKINL